MTPESFISRWSAASANERSNSQLFLSELADLLGVERPHNNFDKGYAFEFTVTEHHHDGTTSERRIDLYKRACFVLESKQFQAPKPKLTQVEIAALAAGALAPKKRSGPIRWLRPDYQIPLFTKSPPRNLNLNLPIPSDTDSTDASTSTKTTEGARSTRAPNLISRDAIPSTSDSTRAKISATSPNSKLKTVASHSRGERKTLE